MTASNNDAHTILVVEDEVLIRMEIAAYLRECGYKVVEVWKTISRKKSPGRFCADA